MTTADPQPVSVDEEPQGRGRVAAVESHEARNLLVLAAHQVVLRISWIFKTESVMMPAFLDMIAGAGWIRGFLPVFNRIGHSVPQLYFAEPLRRTRRKKWALVALSVAMAAPFLTLSGILFLLENPRQPWLPAVFLLLYFAFFSATGMKVLAFGTLQGKLIRAHRRGRLLGLSGVIGAVLAIPCAWLLMSRWLGRPDGGFGYLFGFTGTGLLVAGFLGTALWEPADERRERRRTRRRHFRQAWRLVRQDPDFRKLIIVAMLFVTAQLLFPHYQALGRERAGSQRLDLMTWVIVQNAGTGLFSLLVGPIADRFGYRLVVRLCVFAAALTPIAALGLAGEWLPAGAGPFWLTFFLLGLTPVTFRSFSNFALELADPSQHPRYLSTLKLSMAVPFVFSPVVGWLVDLVGFEAVFGTVAALIALGGLLTFRLAEPRWPAHVSHETVEGRGDETPRAEPDF